MKYDMEIVMGANLSVCVCVGCHLIALFAVSSTYIHILPGCQVLDSLNFATQLPLAKDTLNNNKATEVLPFSYGHKSFWCSHSISGWYTSQIHTHTHIHTHMYEYIYSSWQGQPDNGNYGQLICQKFHSQHLTCNRKSENLTIAQ